MCYVTFGAFSTLVRNTPLSKAMCLCPALFSTVKFARIGPIGPQDKTFKGNFRLLVPLLELHTNKQHIRLNNRLASDDQVWQQGLKPSQDFVFFLVNIWPRLICMSLNTSAIRSLARLAQIHADCGHCHVQPLTHLSRPAHLCATNCVKLLSQGIFSRSGPNLPPVLCSTVDQKVLRVWKPPRPWKVGLV